MESGNEEKQSSEALKMEADPSVFFTKYHSPASAPPIKTGAHGCVTGHGRIEFGNQAINYSLIHYDYYYYSVVQCNSRTIRDRSSESQREKGTMVNMRDMYRVFDRKTTQSEHTQEKKLNKSGDSPAPSGETDQPYTHFRE